MSCATFGIFAHIELFVVFWNSRHWPSCVLSIGFPYSLAGKEFTCNAGDPGSIPGLGRFPGEGIGYPLQYSWASLVAQLVQNLPAVQETWVWSLCWEDPLEKGKATHSVFWPGEFHRLYSPWGRRVGHNQVTLTFTHWHLSFWELQKELVPKMKTPGCTPCDSRLINRPREHALTYPLWQRNDIELITFVHGRELFTELGSGYRTEF